MSVDIDALCREAGEDPNRLGDGEAVKAVLARLGLPVPADSTISLGRMKGRLPYLLVGKRAFYRVRDFVGFCVKPAGHLNGQGRGIGKAKAAMRAAAS